MFAFNFTNITQDIAAGSITTLNINANTLIGAPLLKIGDVVNVEDNNNGLNTTFVIAADQATADTTLTVTAKTTTNKIHAGSVVNISYSNLAIQYQRKTEGSIGGIPVDSDGLGAFEYKGGVYYLNNTRVMGVDDTVGYIKILPRDFLTNYDNLNKAWGFYDSSDTGVAAGNASQELIASINIPYNMKATTVNVWGSATAKVVEVYEANINANGIGSAIGTGTTNGSDISLTGTPAHTTTNYLIIKVTVTATSNRIFGGKVTVASI
tara:strand:+ start:1650 stop:2447 length:798 start_codon:yes stop_codon:yes gene_type:complete